MNNILKLFFAFVLLVSNVGLGQEYKDGFSDAVLEVQNQEIPVKLFSNNDIERISNALESNHNEVLIILNKFNTTPSNVREQAFFMNYYNDFRNRGYLVLDENFQVVLDENVLSYKYILKSKNANVLKNISEGNTELSTIFNIWDPAEGINLFGFNLRFYGLMFVIAFGLGLLIMKFMFKIDGVDEKYLDPLFTWTLLGTIFGARIGHVLFYEANLFKEDFWSVFLPIRTKPTLEFTGFSGLASHGAAIALILTTIYYSLRIIKKNPLWVFDRLGIVVALAGFFIRLGNFFNSEIIGKPVNAQSPLAIYFPQQSMDYGFTVPRYPTQLIEAVGYLCLFLLLWALYRMTNKKYQQGWLFGLFFVILWSIRFFTEFLKEPQGEEYISFLGLNTGQILSLPFILIGVVIMIYSRRQKVDNQ